MVDVSVDDCCVGFRLPLGGELMPAAAATAACLSESIVEAIVSRVDIDPRDVSRTWLL